MIKVFGDITLEFDIIGGQAYVYSLTDKNGDDIPLDDYVEYLITSYLELLGKNIFDVRSN